MITYVIFHINPKIYLPHNKIIQMTIFFRYIDKELKERHRKKSVIQMKNGAPVYDSEEGTEEEPVP